MAVGNQSGRDTTEFVVSLFCVHLRSLCHLCYFVVVSVVILSLCCYLIDFPTRNVNSHHIQNSGPGACSVTHLWEQCGCYRLEINYSTHDDNEITSHPVHNSDSLVCFWSVSELCG